MIRCPFCLEDIAAGSPTCPACAEPLEHATEMALASAEDIDRARDLRKSARYAGYALSHGLGGLVLGVTCGPVALMTRSFPPIGCLAGLVFLLGPTAIGYGAYAMTLVRRHRQPAPGRATAGVILGAIATLLWLGIALVGFANTVLLR